MKIKKMIDAEELKEQLAHIRDSEAIKIVEEMQGYHEFYAFIVSRRYGKEANIAVEEIPDDEFHNIVSVVANNESQARKRIKERLGTRPSVRWNHDEWQWLTIKFVDKDTAMAKTFYAKNRNRYYELIEL